MQLQLRLGIIKELNTGSFDNFIALQQIGSRDHHIHEIFGNINFSRYCGFIEQLKGKLHKVVNSIWRLNCEVELETIGRAMTCIFGKSPKQVGKYLRKHALDRGNQCCEIKLTFEPASGKIGSKLQSLWHRWVVGNHIQALEAIVLVVGRVIHHIINVETAGGIVKLIAHKGRFHL